MKIPNDAYYTPVDLANELWDKTVEMLCAENIRYVIEPSCGNGAFLQHPKYRVDFAVDIATECCGMADMFVKGDYLATDFPYRKGTLVIGNPPFGPRMHLAQKFFKHSIKFADYIAFILPISQLNNTQSLYEFDLIYSEDLGVCDYSGRKLHCCFNIYRRPTNGINDKPKVTPLVKIIRQDASDYDSALYDVRMCYWGDGSAGKILSEGEHYSGEYKIKVLDNERKDEIIEFIKSYPWMDSGKGIAMRRIKQFHIHQILADRFGVCEPKNLFNCVENESDGKNVTYRGFHN